MERSPPSAIWAAIASATVFIIAVVLRVPSCYESFWIDELHSAWTVWGDLGEVVPRASAGNQSPFYFVALWFWKQCLGDGEVALRLSSVLAVAAGCAVLTAGIARWSRSLVAGCVAGLVLACESNSIFFGTELRPYAWVILFSAIAAICFLRLAMLDSREDGRRSWMIMNAAILMAILCQPTAIGVLALLPLTLAGVWLIRDRRRLLRFSVADAFILLGIAAVGFTVWTVVAKETWQRRQNWAAFASADRVGQIWEAWNWTWLLLCPLVVLAIAKRISKIRSQASSTRRMFYASLLIALIAVVGTVLYWVLSWSNVLPIWHRRYFIAVLPMFACVCGGAIGLLDSSLASHRLRGWIMALVAAALVIALPYQQGTLQRLHRYPVALAVRGENWRAAIDWARTNAESNDLLFVDAGLIENKSWMSGQNGTPLKLGSESLSKPRIQYLTYAVNGPYSLGRHSVPFHASTPFQGWTKSVNRSRRIFAILRVPSSRIGTSLPPGSRVIPFGGVSVVVQLSTNEQSP